MAWHDVGWRGLKQKRTDAQPHGQTRRSSRRGGRSAGVAKPTTAAKGRQPKPPAAG
jgi:hypothetical protein